MKISDFISAEIEKLDSGGEYIPDFLDDIAKMVSDKFNTKCIVNYIGGFESPGYDIDCYAFAYIENGDVVIYSYNHESY